MVRVSPVPGPSVGWTFGDRSFVTAAATGRLPDACGSGRASAGALGAHEFQLLFETRADARLILTCSQEVQIFDAPGDSLASSSFTLGVEGGPDLVARVLSRTAPGREADSIGTEVYLPPGRYRLSAEGHADAAAQSDNGSVPRAAGSWFSCELKLSPIACARVIDEPDDLSVRIGGAAALSVVATGDPNLTYRWSRNGIPLSDGATPGGSYISGSSLNSLSISHVSAADAGLYRCAVTNLCGQVTSRPATLMVCIADFNNSGAATVQDIFDFLAAFFGGDSHADINASGSVTVQDIFDFLAAWFAGC